MAKNNAGKNRKNRLKVLRKEKLKKQKNPRRLKLRIILLIVLLFAISIAEFVYFAYSIKYVKVYDVFLRVDNKVGINVDVENSTLNLGIVPLGGSVKREIVIVNTGDEPLAGNVITKGNLAQFLSVEKNFTIQKDEAKSLSVIADIPRDTKKGNYTGKIIIVFRKV